MPEKILNLGGTSNDGAFQSTDNGKGFVSRISDTILNAPASTPIDFVAQFPQPLDTTELIAMCEEISFYKQLPELGTSLKSETWRELNELAFTSGSSYISFADGACPEAFYHDGDNTTIDLKNIGAYKSLTISDIMHSAAVSSMSRGPYGVGISRLVGGFAFGEGMPGGNQEPSLLAQTVGDLKAKEMALAGVLVLNGWDNLLVNGNASSNALEFSGVAKLLTPSATCSVHSNTGTYASGTFTALAFDRFVAEGCAKPDTLLMHPQVAQEVMSAYFSLGFQGSQIIYNNDGNRLVPGYNFAGEVNTAVGALKVIADRHVAATANGTGQLDSTIYALRMVHNGEPLVYSRTQIPLAFKDLVPGCTAIQFMIWAKTALIVKACCAQGAYRWNTFTGRTVTTCPVV